MLEIAQGLRIDVGLSRGLREGGSIGKPTFLLTRVRLRSALQIAAGTRPFL
jgi:hypothetical protein